MLKPHDCFLLLPAPKLPGKRALTEALKAFPELGAVELELGEHLVLRAGDVELLATLLPPMPEGAAEEAAEYSLSGLEGSWAPAPHRAQLAVVQGGGKPSLQGLVVFTRLVAALTRATRALGVFWASAHATHHPEFVVDIAQSELPLPLWVGLSLARGSKRAEVLSLGMDHLGLADLLLVAPEVTAAELEFFYELLATSVRLGRKLREGERVGRTPKEKLAVRFVASPVEKRKKVWRVTLGKKSLGVK